MILDYHLQLAPDEILASKFFSDELRTILYYRPQTKFAKVMFLHLSVGHSVHGGHAWHDRGHAWWGPCMAGGHAWWGVCMAGGVHDGGCVAGGMHGGGVHGRGMHDGGACMAGGHAWQGACMVGASMVGGMHDRRHVWQAGPACHACPPDTMRYGRSMRGRYASYWNAFLLFDRILFQSL